MSDKLPVVEERGGDNSVGDGTNKEEIEDDDGIVIVEGPVADSYNQTTNDYESFPPTRKTATRHVPPNFNSGQNAGYVNF